VVGCVATGLFAKISADLARLPISGSRYASQRAHTSRSLVSVGAHCQPSPSLLSPPTLTAVEAEDAKQLLVALALRLVPQRVQHDVLLRAATAVDQQPAL
jgi:hypothetical protein